MIKLFNYFQIFNKDILTKLCVLCIKFMIVILKISIEHVNNYVYLQYSC